MMALMLVASAAPAFAIIIYDDVGEGLDTADVATSGTLGGPDTAARTTEGLGSLGDPQINPAFGKQTAQSAQR